MLTVASGPVMMNPVLIDVDKESGKALAIERLDKVIS